MKARFKADLSLSKKLREGKVGTLFGGPKFLGDKMAVVAKVSRFYVVGTKSEVLGHIKNNESFDCYWTTSPLAAAERFNSLVERKMRES